MPEKYRRTFMKDKESRAILSQAAERLKANIEQLLKSKVKIELIETDFASVFLINGRPVLVKLGKDLFPTLVFNEFLACMPKAVVDMGAVPHVCNGANVMRPGIKCFDGEAGKGDFVLVVDEKYGKPLAIGEMLLDKSEAEGANQGIVIRNVHFVGDKTWNFMKDLS